MKDAYYFSHDYHARSDEKIIRLLQSQGPLGYGLYWMIIEMLYEGAGSIPQDYNLLAFEMRTQCDSIKTVCEDFDLFYFRDNRIFSKSVDRRLAERENRSFTARNSAMKRWGDNAKAMPMQCDSNAVKERKGKERKGKERTISTAPDKPDADIEFLEFWKAYPKKSGKHKALESWKKKKPPLKDCLTALGWQTKTDQWLSEAGKYIPLPATWLNQGRWHDEPLNAANKATGMKPCELWDGYCKMTTPACQKKNAKFINGQCYIS